MAIRFTSEKYCIRLTVVKAVVSSEGTCNNCLFVEVFNHFLKYNNEIFNFLTSNS